MTTAEDIDCAIARWWTEPADDLRIAERCRVPLKAVIDRRRALDAINQVEDSFKHAHNKPQAKCPQGHFLTPDNVYERPNKSGRAGRRQCRMCQRRRQTEQRARKRQRDADTRAAKGAA